MFNKIQDIVLVFKEKFAKLQLFSAMLLGPFELLQREFGWEGGSY
jgi:hypothetical protein